MKFDASTLPKTYWESEDSYADIERMFTYHASPERVKHFEALTEGTKQLAHIFDNHIPPGPDKDQALNFLRLARMMGNAAIACEGR